MFLDNRIKKLQKKKSILQHLNEDVNSELYTE
jgi:hypothetical protein